MAKQLRLARKWASRPFVEGGAETIDLPLGTDVESILVDLSGNITNSAAFDFCKLEGMAKLIKRVEIVHNGETVAEISGEMLVNGNFARAGGIANSKPAVAIGTSFGEVVGFIDFAHIGGMRPKDSVLCARHSRQLQLRITYGRFSDMFGGAGVVSGHTLALKVSLRETKELEVAPEAQVRRIFKLSEKIFPTSTVERIPMDPNTLYRGLVLRCESNGDLSAAVLNSVKVHVGSDVVFEMDATSIRDVNAQDYGWMLPAGYYVVDFAPAPEGLAMLSDFLDTYGRSDVFLTLDVNGGNGNKVNILSHRFEWDDQAAARNEALLAVMEQHQAAA